MATAAAAPARFPVGNQRILSSWWGVRESFDVRLSTELEGAMLSDTVFRFLDGSPDSSVSSSGSTEEDMIVEEVKEEEQEEEEEDEATRIEANRVFWEKHHKLFKETMSKTSSTEKAIKNATKEVIKEIREAAQGCKCSSTSEQVISSCKNCLMGEICRRLTDREYDDCAVWKTKWSNKVDIPSGEHKFIIITTTTNNDNLREEVIIEPRFRAEFEMGIREEECNNNYSQLMERVPSVFVGKPERMKAVVKIICSAAKMCSKEKKLHLGPWRKHKYMHAKWFSSSCNKLLQTGDNEDVVEPMVLVTGGSGRVPSSKTTTSMLTVAFMGNNSNSLRPKTVAVQ